MEITLNELRRLPMALRMEIEENVMRKDLTISEKVKLAKIIEPYMKQAAKERLAATQHRGPQKSGGANVGAAGKGKSRDKVAGAAGLKHSTLSKATEVVEAAESKPEKFGRLVEEMDAGKVSVNQAYNAVVREKQKEKNAELAKRHEGRIQGDVRLGEDLSSVADGSVDLIVADPPYNISGQAGSAKKDGVIVNADFGEWDRRPAGEYLEWIASYFPEFRRVLKDSGSFYLFADKRLIGHFWDFALKAGLVPKNILVWHKTNPVPQARRNWWSAAEFILFGVKSAAYRFNAPAGGPPLNVISVPVCAGRERTIHPTQKPVALLKTLVEVSSDPGDLVLDCFAGSGSSGAAARDLGRDFILIEKDPDCINLIKARLAGEAAQSRMEV